MKYYQWDPSKNELARSLRGICFEDIETAIEDGRLLDVIESKNKARYPNQQIYVVEIGGYVYLVPFVEDEEKYFLKTIFASRKMTRKYFLERSDI
jgi:uncharacterized DUF497 family protein